MKKSFSFLTLETYISFVPFLTSAISLLQSVVAMADADWQAGLLSLPESEERRAALAVRAKWAHIATQLADRAAFAARLRKIVAESEGTLDEVLESMVLRHLGDANLKRICGYTSSRTCSPFSSVRAARQH